MAGTAADRLLRGPATPPGGTGRARDEGRPRDRRGEPRPDAAPDGPSTDEPADTGSTGASAVGGLPPGATTAAATSSGADASPGPDATPGPVGGAGPPGSGHGGAGIPLLPPGAGATGGGADRGGSARRHPEYLVDADPWADGAEDPAERRLVTPPVLGEDDR